MVLDFGLTPTNTFWLFFVGKTQHFNLISIIVNCGI